MSARTKSFTESFVLTILFAVACDKLLQELPGISEYSVTTGAAVRFLLLAIACLSFGSWIGRRISRDLLSVGFGFAAALSFTFWHRFALGDVEPPIGIDDVAFDLALFALNWTVLFAGAWWSRQRQATNT